MLTQKHGGIQKNAALLNENVKITMTVKQKKNKKYSLTLILMNFCSTDNDSDDSDGERSDSNIDYAHRLNIRFFLKDFLFSHVFIAHTK